MLTQPMLPTTRIDWIVLPKRSDAPKSVVSWPMPLLRDALGRRVEKRRPRPGRHSPSGTSLIFAPIRMSSTECVESPVAVTTPASGAAGSRLSIDMKLYGPPVICRSAIELRPTFTPRTGNCHKLPFRPYCGYVTSLAALIQPSTSTRPAPMVSGSCVSRGRCCAAAGAAHTRRASTNTRFRTSGPLLVCRKLKTDHNMSAALVTIRSVVGRRLQDVRDALTTIPDWQTWRTCGLVYGLFLIGALPTGLASGLIRPATASLTPIELIGSGLLLFVQPALIEEIVFRGLLLPRDARSWPRRRLIPVAGVALVVYVVSHPINAMLFRPRVLSVFESMPYLLLTTLLGVTCTVTYLMSRSIWPSVAIHWLTVVTWIWLLGGRALLC